MVGEPGDTLQVGEGSIQTKSQNFKIIDIVTYEKAIKEVGPEPGNVPRLSVMGYWYRTGVTFDDNSDSLTFKDILES
jgi:hypothetical protein